jgi:hypothetical protein
MVGRISLVIVFLGLALLPGALARAQTPTPGPTRPLVEEFPYRFVVSGPGTARGGENVTYRVTYERLYPDRPESPGFIFYWPREGVSFVSFTAVDGPAGSTEPQTDNAIRWGLDSRPPSGAVEVTLQIAADFTGDLQVGIYVPGTGISYPEGSTASFTTQVSAPASDLPPTGVGPGDAGRPAWPWLAAIAGAALVAVGAPHVRPRT